MVNIKKKCMNSTPQSVKICYENDSKQQVSFNGKKKSFLRTNAANQQTENIQCWVKKSQKKQQNIEDMYSSSPP